MVKRNKDYNVEETFANNNFIPLTKENTNYYNKKLEEDEKIFSYERFASEIHTPIEVLPASLNNLGQLARCLDMPLRLSGETEYKLPTQWEKLAPTLNKLISVEHKHNPNWKDYYTYLTVDSTYVSPAEQQRHGGFHVDGFQGERHSTKHKLTRNYVATNNGGTIFWAQPFICADPKKFNIFQGFELQVDSEPLVAKENMFYFMDALTVHESGFAQYKGIRNFIRLTYDLKPFDRLGNTHNPNLDYNWDMVKRNVWDNVQTPKITDILESPYNIIIHKNK